MSKKQNAPKSTEKDKPPVEAAPELPAQEVVSEPPVEEETQTAEAAPELPAEVDLAEEETTEAPEPPPIAEEEDEDEDFDPEQWELARRLFQPGEKPDGTVSGVMENGEQLTLPVATAIALVKWMHSLPPTTPDDGQRRIWSCRMDVATEKHLRDTVTVWTYPEAFEKTFPL